MAVSAVGVAPLSPVVAFYLMTTTDRTYFAQLKCLNEMGEDPPCEKASPTRLTSVEKKFVQAEFDYALMFRHGIRIPETGWSS